VVDGRHIGAPPMMDASKIMKKMSKRKIQKHRMTKITLTKSIITFDEVKSILDGISWDFPIEVTCNGKTQVINSFDYFTIKRPERHIPRSLSGYGESPPIVVVPPLVMLSETEESPRQPIIEHELTFYPEEDWDLDHPDYEY
jgi:hypothetical protein